MGRLDFKSSRAAVILSLVSSILTRFRQIISQISPEGVEKTFIDWIHALKKWRAFLVDSFRIIIVQHICRLSDPINYFPGNKYKIR